MPFFSGLFDALSALGSYTLIGFFFRMGWDWKSTSLALLDASSWLWRHTLGCLFRGKDKPD